MSDLKARIKTISQNYQKIKEGLKLESKKKELKRLELKSSQPKFWDNQEEARSVMQKIDELQEELKAVDKLNQDINDLTELAKEKDLVKGTESEIKRIEKELRKFKLTTYLSGKYDPKNAIVAIHAGQGGTEAMDWTSMLFRMYLRFCENRGWKTEVFEETPGEEAGIKSITFRVEGSYAYGYLKGEAGTHRLVRQSPFNADKLRQTSFALVEVLPEFEEIDLPDIEIKDEDLKWQFFRASSQGGQNVQKVSTAVRLTHSPTGIVVSAQTERYQEQNRKYALNLLRAKLWAKKQEELQKEKKAVSGEYTPATWGTQIRSYVLHPYKMVKDLRTEIETSDTEAVLDGDLDLFIEAELKLKSD